MYIYPLKDQKIALKDVLKMDIESYPIVDKDQREYIVKEYAPEFCYDCFYLVVVSTETTFDGEIIFLRNKDPIPLTTNHILK